MTIALRCSDALTVGTTDGCTVARHAKTDATFTLTILTKPSSVAVTLVLGETTTMGGAYGWIVRQYTGAREGPISLINENVGRCVVGR